jgi:two-component system, OmpR family, response regulator
MRILLIEDEPEMASVLKTALERRDVVVDHVSTLADAEAVAKFGPFDAVVLDRRLPDGEGLSLIPRLRTLHVDVRNAASRHKCAAGNCTPGAGL